MIFEVLFLLTNTLTSKVEITRLQDSDPQEVAVKGSVELERSVDLGKFKNCAPRESKPFPKALSSDQEKLAFEPKELKDLMSCKIKECAFNYLESEVEKLEKMTTEKARKDAFFEFLQNRVRGITPALDPKRSALFIRSSEKKAFESCGEQPTFQKLLDLRPSKDLPYRMSLVRYRDNMRPTTRLLQGVYFDKDADSLCYGEALIYATHYDSDRVEVWNWKQTRKDRSELTLIIRHRIDLLNTWIRRMNKPAFVNQLNDLISAQLIN